MNYIYGMHTNPCKTALAHEQARFEPPVKHILYLRSISHFQGIGGKNEDLHMGGGLRIFGIGLPDFVWVHHSRGVLRPKYNLTIPQECFET